uniref:Growth-regulating factor n=1 Tax=Ananas comosus var. bracteatus TaxID=296719 RepID=A0A6V7QX30_ANACO
MAKPSPSFSPAGDRTRSSPRFSAAHSVGYCSYFGKKLDPEPGRCRRTDGKKWRCSKEAYPDSKYCERHMHRGRNRSRKPVESPQPSSVSHSAATQHSPSASTVTTVVPSGSSGGNGGGTCGSFQSNPLHSIAGGSSNSAFTIGSSQLQMEHAAYGTAGSSKDFRYAYGAGAALEEHSLFSEASGSLRGLAMDSSLDSSWRVLPSQISPYSLSTARGGTTLDSGNYPQFAALPDMGHSLSRPDRPQLSFFGNEFGSDESVKHESQTLRPFFDEWPKGRDSWTDIDEERSNRVSLSTTQLSISIPMTSSDFATSSGSPLSIGSPYPGYDVQAKGMIGAHVTIWMHCEYIIEEGRN